MTQLQLQLLGGFRLSQLGGAENPVRSRKGRALLAYLALNANSRPTREKLATLLWGDRFEEQARQSLRQIVLSLRKALGDADASILVSEEERLKLDTEAVAVDVHTLAELTAEGFDGLAPRIGWVTLVVLSLEPIWAGDVSAALIEHATGRQKCVYPPSNCANL